MVRYLPYKRSTSSSTHSLTPPPHQHRTPRAPAHRTHCVLLPVALPPLCCWCWCWCCRRRCAAAAVVAPLLLLQRRRGDDFGSLLDSEHWRDITKCRREITKITNITKIAITKSQITNHKNFVMTIFVILHLAGIIKNSRNPFFYIPGSEFFGFVADDFELEPAAKHDRSRWVGSGQRSIEVVL